MQPSRRCLLLSILCATISVGPLALAPNVSERFAIFVLLLWVLLVIAFFRGFVKLEVLWFMDRDWATKRAGMHPPPVHISPPPPPPPETEQRLKAAQRR
jgi:hypothetical protein